MPLRSLSMMVMLVAMIGLAAPIRAHSEKEGTTPADGALLTESPEMIHMVFNTPMRITMVRLVGADGAELPIARGTGLEPSLEFHAEPGLLAPGGYTVQWRGLASDGHAMQGSFSFELAE